MSINKGDRVYVDPNFPNVPGNVLGRVFVVDKVNPRNVRCHAEDGGRGINYPAESLLPYEGGDVPVARALTPVEPAEFFVSGEVVTLTRPWREWTTDTPLVVLQDKVNKVNVTLLGGNDGRYLRITRDGLTRRSMEWLAESLLERVA